MYRRFTHAYRSGTVHALAATLALAAPAGAQAAVAPKITSGPTIEGTAQVGVQLTATATWSGDPAPTATWRWLRCAKTADMCATIGGATTAAYSPTITDVGALLRVRLTVRNSAGSDEQRSAPTAAVAPVPTPTPTATATPSATATATPTPTPTQAPMASPTPSVDPEPSPSPTPEVSFDVVSTPASQPSSPTSPTAAANPTRLRLLKPFPVIRIRGVLVPQGARVTLLTVRSPSGARIVVRCRGRDCPVRRFTPRPGTRRLRPFERELRAGTRLEIIVVKPGFIGKRTVFVIRRGAAPRRSDGCVDSATQRVVQCPPG